MSKNSYKLYEILTAAADIGAAMMEYGGEVYRVENSIQYILEAYGCDKDKIDVFAIPSSIVVTIEDEEGKPLTITKRTKQNEFDLYKIDKLNSLSRHICRRKPSYRSIKYHTEKILNAKRYPLWVELICYAIVGFSFTLFFQGNVYDGFSGAFVALMIKVIRWLIEKFDSNEFFICFICSGFAAFAALMSVYLGLADNSDKIIIGSLMTLVPGIAITNCMRDLIMGDFVAGLSRMADAILTAVGIATGTMAVLTVSRII